jgi:hypothetical protein
MAYRVGRPGTGENEGSFVLSGNMDRVSWGAIIAGVAAALAVQVLLALVGMAAGLASLDFASAETVGIGSMFYWVFAGIASLFAGGFVAGRMAGVPLMTATVLHGAMVWSVVTVLSALMAVGGASAFVSGASRMAVQMSEVVLDASEGMAEMLPDDLDNVLPNELTAEIRESLGDDGMSAQQIRAEAREIARTVIDQSERQQAAEIVRSTGMAILREPGDANQEIASAMDRLIGPGGVIGPQDRDELVAELGSRFDLSESEANALIDRWAERVRDIGAEAQQSYQAVSARLGAAADEAADATASAAFWAALATFFGLIAASAGSLLGRPEDLVDVEVARSRTQAAE